MRKKDGTGCKEEEGDGYGTRLEGVRKKEVSGCKKEEGDWTRLEHGGRRKVQDVKKRKGMGKEAGRSEEEGRYRM
jgi:hypothetical protein